VRGVVSAGGRQTLGLLLVLDRAEVKIPTPSDKTRQGWGTLVFHFAALGYGFVPSYDAFFAAAFVREQEASLGAEELLWGNV
jgi:hypothetical protein